MKINYSIDIVIGGFMMKKEFITRRKTYHIYCDHYYIDIYTLYGFGKYKIWEHVSQTYQDGKCVHSFVNWFEDKFYESGRGSLGSTFKKIKEDDVRH